jgi:superfamily II DNA or RNA helicase
VSTVLALRPYQRESIAAVRSAWAGGQRRPAVVLPTGMGKTVIFASMVDEWLRDPFRPPGAILILVHREELATQTAEKIHMINPDVPVGVCKAERDELDRPVIVGSVQTLARENRRRRLPPVGLVIVDECHHAAANSYMKILEHVGAFAGGWYDGHGHNGYDAGALAVGFTATMDRSDRRGLGNVWQDVVYRKDILWGIQNNDCGPCAPGEGYLTDVRGIQLSLDGLDLHSVAVRQGDYADGDMGRALETSGALGKMVEGYREHAADRQGIVFLPTVATAHAYAEISTELGVSAAVVDGTTPTEDRALVYKRMRAGDCQVIANCGVLTEGFDMPQVSAIMPKMTASNGLYIQMIGRGVRPWPGKTECVVLDPVGVSGRLSLAGIVNLSDHVVQPRDGESLAEAVERAEKEAAGQVVERPARGVLLGKLAATEVDLFHGSRSAWLQTFRGVWFIPTREATYFLWPDGSEGHWKIGRCGVYSAKGGQWLRGELSLEYAMAIAEQQAKETDPSVSQRDSSWRFDKQISDGQKNMAMQYGIEIGEDMRKGEVSDKISIAIASRFLDRGKR